MHKKKKLPQTKKNNLQSGRKLFKIVHKFKTRNKYKDTDNCGSLDAAALWQRQLKIQWWTQNEAPCQTHNANGPQRVTKWLQTKYRAAPFQRVASSSLAGLKVVSVWQNTKEFKWKWQKRTMKWIKTKIKVKRSEKNAHSKQSEGSSHFDVQSHKHVAYFALESIFIFLLLHHHCKSKFTLCTTKSSQRRVHVLLHNCWTAAAAQSGWFWSRTRSFQRLSFHRNIQRFWKPPSDWSFRPAKNTLDSNAESLQLQLKLNIFLLVNKQSPLTRGTSPPSTPLCSRCTRRSTAPGSGTSRAARRRPRNPSSWGGHRSRRRRWWGLLRPGGQRGRKTAGSGRDSRLNPWRTKLPSSSLFKSAVRLMRRKTLNAQATFLSLSAFFFFHQLQRRRLFPDDDASPEVALSEKIWKLQKKEQEPLLVPIQPLEQF